MQTIAQTAGYPMAGTAPPGAFPGTMDKNVTSTERLADLEKLFLAHNDRVYRAAYRVTGNASDAEDVLQTVFLRLLRQGSDFKSVEDAGNYLYRAGVNAALDIVRSRRSAAAVPLGEEAPHESAWKPDRGHHSPELRDKLRSAIARLHETAAEMFVLRYFEGFDNAEIARLMSTSEGTVAVTLHRTRARLQKELGGIK